MLTAVLDAEPDDDVRTFFTPDSDAGGGERVTQPLAVEYHPELRPVRWLPGRIRRHQVLEFLDEICGMPQQ